MSLQENNEKFRLYVLLVNILKKVRFSINCIIVGKERNGYYPTKNAFFNILSFTNQLHKSKSTYLEGSEHGKIYFLENHVLDHIKLRLKYLPQAVKAYKEVIQKNTVHKSGAYMLEKSRNKAVDELFKQTKEDAAVISNFKDLFD